MTSNRKALLILALCFGLLVLVLAVEMAIFCMDDPPPDDADLRLVRLDIPDDQNAFTYWAQAIVKLDLPKDDEPWPPASPGPASPAPAPAGKSSDSNAQAESPTPPPSKKERFQEMADGLLWDQALADEVLKRNAEALALWERGLAAPHFQIPEMKTLEDWSTPVPWGHLDIARLAAVRARLLREQGRPEAALAEAMKIVQFGAKAEGGKGPLLDCLVSLTIRNLGYEVLRSEAARADVPASACKRVAAELATLPAKTPAMRDALCAEYAVFCLIIEKVRQGTMSEGDFVGSSDLTQPGQVLDPAARLFVQVVQKPFLKPNRTRRDYGDFIRTLIAESDKPYPSRRDVRAELEERRGRVSKQPLAAGLGGNILGESLIQLVAPSSDGVLCMWVRSRVQFDVTRLTLALRAYKADKGRLPDSLDPLVPDYLDAVPLDAFDGKPLRYNPAKKVLYSVGNDLKDDGGMTFEECVDFVRRERGLDGTTADPNIREALRQTFRDMPEPSLEELRQEARDRLWDMPDPSFPIDF